MADEDGAGRRRLPAIIVLLSDGANTSGRREPARGGARGAPACGSRSTPSRSARRTARSSRPTPTASASASRCRRTIETLQEIARTTRGRFFEAEDADQLESIYANLGTRLSSKPEQEEVTAVFAGGALLLLVAGGALSLAWFGRLPG